MKTFKLTVTEGELLALIYHHSRIIQNHIEDNDAIYPSIETSERIHALTKRLNRDIPEIENDPRSVPQQFELPTLNVIKKENNEW